MKTTQFELRFRLWISFALYLLGFWAPWLRYGSLAAPFSTARLEVAGDLSHWLTLQTASDAFTIAAIALAALGALFRVWGTVNSSGAKTRYSYLGDLLFAVAIAIFMPPSGAAVFLILTVVQLWRLAQLPGTAAPVPQSLPQSRWQRPIIAALIGEIFYIAMAICFAVLAWRYDPTLLIQALLVCFGFSLVARAFVLRAA